MTNFSPLLERNRAFAEAHGGTEVPVIPRYLTFVVACLDPRVDPAAVLGVGLGDAIVLRNAGGRVTDETIADIALVSYIGEVMGAGTGDSPLEVAVIHHTQCGTGFLADGNFRQTFAARTGLDETALAQEAVVDPASTVRADVERLLSSPLASARITVSGHVHDLETGLVTTVVAPTAPHAALGDDEV
jgi:carbonic anhydrase